MSLKYKQPVNMWNLILQFLISLGRKEYISKCYIEGAHLDIIMKFSSILSAVLELWRVQIIILMKLKIKIL